MSLRSQAWRVVKCCPRRRGSLWKRRERADRSALRPVSEHGGCQEAPPQQQPRVRATSQEPREEAKEREDEQQGSRGQNPRLPIGIHQRPRYRSLGNPEGRVCPNPLPQPSGPTQLQLPVCHQAHLPAMAVRQYNYTPMRTRRGVAGCPLLLACSARPCCRSWSCVTW